MKKNNNKDVSTFIENVKKAIQAEYGVIPDEYYVSLAMLETNFKIFLETSEYIDKKGMVVEDYRGMEAPNPMIKVNMQSQASCNKILNSFGLTPYSRKKMDGNTQLSEYSALDEFLG